MKHRCIFPYGAVCAALVLAAWGYSHPAWGQAQVSPPSDSAASPAPAPSKEAPAATEKAAAAKKSAEPKPPPDPGVQIFTMKCAGCHTVGGGTLTGPDLKVVQAWPRTDLTANIKRMEKNVGPLQDDEIQKLANLLQSADAQKRIKAEQQRIAMAQAAKLEPGSPEIGRLLFQGRRPLQNGGLACAACHHAAGSGGNLAVDLHDSYKRLGETAILSILDNPGFPLMRAVYQKRPITKQEAIHLVKYLQTVSQTPPAPYVPPIHPAGFAGAVAVMVLVGIALRRRNRGVRRQLVEKAKGSTRS